MERIMKIMSLFLLVFLLFASCKKKSPTHGDDNSSGTCGEGKGFPVEFCRQVDHYENGFGVPGQDIIRVDCIVGPVGATVSNQKNGTYYCAGTYKLTTYNTATINLNWGGTTQYTLYDEYEIPAKGEGTFSIKLTKKSGGDGNIYLSMSSGSNWMFDTVLVNLECNQTAPKIHPVITNEASSLKKSGGIIEKKQKYTYYSVE